MQLSAYYKLLQENEEKIPLIDRITEYHPAMGTDLGWSYYIGGMRDTGEWYVEKLLLESKERLQGQIQKWQLEEIQLKEMAEKWAKKTLEEQQEEISKQMKKLHWEFERKLIWGK
jgi:hypothetical protein